MHNITSLAQTLSPDVQRPIIEYLVEGLLAPGVVPHDRMRPMRELLYVSSLWRQEALKYIWRVLSVSIDNEIVVRYPMFAKNFSCPDNAPELVKELHVQVSLSSIASGRAYILLSEFMGNIKRLPFARKLFIEFKDCPYKFDTTDECNMNNVRKFSLLLQSMVEVPVVSTEISINNHVFKINEPTKECCGMLLVLLYNTTEYLPNGADKLPLCCDIRAFNIPMVTSLFLKYGSTQMYYIILMHKNASTLLNLDMEVTDASELMYGADGFPVIYPNLQRLRMYDQSDFDCERISIPDIIPFPRLKILDLHLEYPFGDDLPFRGNDVGIEYLTIYIDRRNVEALNNSLEFEKQCKSLKKVTVYEHPRLSDLKSIQPADMTKFIRKLLYSAQIVKLYSDTIVANWIALPSPKHGFESVRALTMTDEYMSLVKILHLIKALPALQKLHVLYYSLGDELDGIAKDELLDYVVSTIGNAGDSLFELHISSFYYSKSEVKPEYAMLFALVCPKLRIIYSTHPKYPINWAKIAAEIAGNGPFAKHASRLRRLLE